MEDIEKMKKVDAKMMKIDIVNLGGKKSKDLKITFMPLPCPLMILFFSSRLFLYPQFFSQLLLLCHFYYLKITEVTMAAMRKNHTGQRQRSNESFTSPTPGSAVRQVACTS